MYPPALYVALKEWWSYSFSHHGVVLFERMASRSCAVAVVEGAAPWRRRFMTPLHAAASGHHTQLFFYGERAA